MELSRRERAMTSHLNIAFAIHLIASLVCIVMVQGAPFA
jgi:hypothetical protein